YQQVAAENGKDWKEQIDETVAVLEYARKKGIEMGGVIFDRTEAELTPADEQKPEPGAVPGGPTDQGGGNQPPGQQPGNGQQDGNQPAADGGEGQPEGKPDKGV
ncbi:phage portal protein, partial [Clostridiaceae bacterium]|nr:phage portal protein [Clostridiaceae bacterium]